MIIPIITRRIFSEMPQWIAGFIDGQSFLPVQASPAELLLSEQEFYLGSKILNRLPPHALIQIDHFTADPRPHHLMVRLLYRQPRDAYTHVYCLENGAPSLLDDICWQALNPTLLPDPKPDVPLWLHWKNTARSLNSCLLGLDAAPPQDTDAPQEGEDAPDSAPPEEENVFRQFLAEHAQASGQPDEDPGAEIPPLPDTSFDTLKTLFHENRTYYPGTIAGELEALLGKDVLGVRQRQRAALLLQYGYRRQPAGAFTFDRAPFSRPLVGRDTALATLEDLLSGAERSSETQTVLLYGPVGHGAGCLLRRLKQAVSGRQIAFVDCNAAGLSLTGSSELYDQSACGTFLRTVFGKAVVVLQNFSTVWHNRTDQDSAYACLCQFLSSHRWLDKFLGVEVPVAPRLIIAVTREFPEEMAQACGSLFASTLDLSEDYSPEEKLDILRARAGEHDLTMTRRAAEKLLDYSPLSLSKALHLVDRLSLRADKDRPCDVPDVTRLLPAPALSPDEQLAGRFWRCRGKLLPAARDLAEQQMKTLATDGSARERTKARRLLTGILDCVPVPAKQQPSRSAVRRDLDRNLLGLDKIKDTVSTWATQPGEQRRGLLLVGPPGTAKTSLSMALSHALGFGDHIVRLDMSHIISRDQLCGTTEVYNATPGLIAEFTQRYKGRQIPFLFDEIDKISPNIMYTLLELLDSGVFADNAYGAIDHRQRPLVFTANQLESIPRPLLDRLLVIHVPSYTFYEKVRLLAFLWQRRMPKAAPLPESLCQTLVRWWGTTGGGRDLQHIVGKLASACENGLWAPGEGDDFHCLRALLGPETYLPPPVTRRPGMAYALAACTDGSGLVTPVQAVDTETTGTFGLGSNAEMLDSAGIARLLAARMAGRAARPAILAMDSAPSERSGPSAGLSEFLALYSLFKGVSLPGVSATGELLIHGEVRAVGGVRNKVYAVVRAAGIIHHLFLPEGNRADITEDLRRALHKAGVQFWFVGSVEEVLPVLKEITAVRPATALSC